jgi:LemA protein
MKKSLIALGCLGVVVLFVLILGLWGVGVYNSLVKSNETVDQAWAQVENVYQRRADLIPNLVKTVEGAADFEKSTLVEVVQARAQVGQIKLGTPKDAQQFAEFEKAQGGLTSALSRLLVVSEQYPTLKANQNFQDLQTQLEGTENRISVERGRFNEVVRTYNTQVKSFPTVFLAGMFGYSPRPYFQAKAGAENAPEVKFDFKKP